MALAVQHGHVDVAIRLLQMGADPSASDHAGLSVLHHAALNVGSSSTTLLVEAILGAIGADPESATGSDGWSVLHAVVMPSLGDSNEEDAEIRAQTVRVLLEAGATIDGKATGNVTPLMVAVFYDTEWDILLQYGASVDNRDSTGDRAIEIVKKVAPRMGYVEDKSIYPEWLSPKVTQRSCALMLIARVLIVLSYFADGLSQLFTHTGKATLWMGY